MIRLLEWQQIRPSARLYRNRPIESSRSAWLERMSADPFARASPVKNRRAPAPQR